MHPNASWTNETFAVQLCDSITPSTSTLYVASQNGNPIWFLLPDCFYFAPSRALSSINLNNVIVQGNYSHPDPLQRVALAISSHPTGFSLVNVILLTNTGAKANINWNALTSITSSVSMLSFTNVSLGIGASLPTFPKAIQILQFASCGLSGTLPAQLFASSGNAALNTFHLLLKGNDFRGSIPSAFFAHVDPSSIKSLSIMVSNCGFSGTIPPTLLMGRFSKLSSVAIDISENQLTGPLNNLFASTSFEGTAPLQLSVLASRNRFNGPLPSWLPSVSSPLSLYILRCESCGLTGPLPPRLFGDATIEDSYIQLNVIDNKISGAIPASFFAMNASPRDIQVSFAGNELESVPHNLFSAANFTIARIVIFNFNSNKLTGNLPSIAGLFGDLTPLEGYLVTFYNNSKMTGTVPPTFLSSIVAHATHSLLATPHIGLYIPFTGLTGELAVPDYSSAPGIRLTIQATDTHFTYLSFPTNATSALVLLDLSSANTLTGVLSTSLFELNPALRHLSAYETNLNGIMPDMGTLNLQNLEVLYLYDTQIDFCSGPRVPWQSTKLGGCLLMGTNAYNCRNYYPKSCSFGTPKAPASVPILAPSHRPHPPSRPHTSLPPTWSLIVGVLGILVLVLGSLARFARDALCPSDKLIQPVSL